MSHDEPDRIPFPIKLDAVSNAEFLAPPPSAVVRETWKCTLDHVERESRRHNVDRRLFLKGLSGSATMLAMLAACSSEHKASRLGVSTSGPTAGTFRVPREATTSLMRRPKRQTVNDPKVIEVSHAPA